METGIRTGRRDMNLLLTPQEAAAVLKCDEKTVRRRIREGRISNVITNGAGGKGVRYLIDMTKEFGIEGRRK